MNTQKIVLNMMALLVGMSSLACDIQNDEEQVLRTIFPVSVVDDEGNALLAGSFDSQTGEVYLVDSLLATMNGPTRTIEEEQRSFVIVEAESWNAGLSVDVGILQGSQDWEPHQSFMLVGLDGLEPRASWNFEIMNRDWISELTEDEAASRFPQCEQPDCGGCTILDEVVITPN